MDECQPLAKGHRGQDARAGLHLRGGRRQAGVHQGRVVQADPINPTLKPPGTMRLKLEYVRLLSSFAFKSNLRRYTKPANEFFDTVTLKCPKGADAAVKACIAAGRACPQRLLKPSFNIIANPCFLSLTPPT